MKRTLKIRELNPFITCGLCQGYLIDATSITECLHTFCRGCLVKYLKERNFCPTCKTVIHHSHPMNFISPDRTMQDIVYKLVPGLQERELQRLKEFEVAMFMYRTGEQQQKAKHSKKDKKDSGESASSSSSPSGSQDNDFHRKDEQIAICMECSRTNGKSALKPLHRKYLRLSSQATVTHLKKFLAKKLKLTNHTDVDILCNNELLGKDHTLKFICVTRWRFKDCPLLLHYRPRLKLY